MTPSFRTRTRLTGTEAREALAELLTRELGVTVTPRALECAFARYWDRISLLAHACHDNYEPPMTAHDAAIAAMHGG